MSTKIVYFYIEKDIHTSSENYKKNSTASICFRQPSHTNRVFHILEEMDLVGKTSHLRPIYLWCTHVKHELKFGKLEIPLWGHHNQHHGRRHCVGNSNMSFWSQDDVCGLKRLLYKDTHKMNDTTCTQFQVHNILKPVLSPPWPFPDSVNTFLALPWVSYVSTIGSGSSIRKLDESLRIGCLSLSQGATRDLKFNLKYWTSQLDALR